MLVESRHLRPVFDVRAADQFGIRVTLAEALIDAMLVRRCIVVELGTFVFITQLICCSDASAVGSGGGNAACIHQCNTGDLTIAGLGALAVGEVARGMTDSQTAVCRGVACAEAGAAECGTDGSTCVDELFDGTLAKKVYHDGLAAGIDAQSKLACSGALAVQQISSFHNIGVSTACTASDGSLIGIECAVMNFAHQIQAQVRILDKFLGIFLDTVQNICHICVQFTNLETVRGVERKRDHTVDGGQVDVNAAVIISNISGVELFEISSTAMLHQEGFRILIGAPDGRQAGGFCRHHIDAVAVIGGHGRDAGSDKLHDFVLDVTIGKDSRNNGDGNILRSDAGIGLAIQIDCYDLRTGSIPCLLQNLFDQFAAAFTNSHRTQRTVARMGVRAEDHFAAASHRFTHILVNNAHVRRNEDAAVFLAGRQAEQMVVLIDGAAHCAQAVVTAGQHVGQRKFVQTRSPCSLDDANIRQVVACDGIKFDFQIFRVTAGIVRLQNAISNRAFFCFFLIERRFCVLFLYQSLAIQQVDTGIIQLNHACYSFYPVCDGLRRTTRPVFGYPFLLVLL